MPNISAGRTLFRMMLMIALTAAPAIAEKVLVDKVVAVVEDEPILKSDIDLAIKQLLFQQGITNLPPGERPQLEKRALDELIGNKLILAKAERLGIQASFTEVEKMVEKTIAERMATIGGEEAFHEQLEAEGLTLDGLRRLYREQIRNQMLVDRVLASEIDRGSLQITDEDIREAYEKRKDEMQQRPAVVHLQTIYFALEGSESAQLRAKAEIEEIARRIKAGEDFAKLAREKSQDPSAKSGGNLGSIRLQDLSEQKFAEAVAALEVGEVSEPVLTSYGYHLIQVTGADSVTQQVQIRHILVRVKAGDKDIQKVFEEANDIRKRLVRGESFDSLAVKYSDDPGTAGLGGDLGWLRLNDLPEFFRDVLRDMKPGDLSPVLREPAGFRIVKLLETEATRPYRFDEVKEELRKVVRQERLATAYEEYLDNLRKQFYVDVRPE